MEAECYGSDLLGVPVKGAQLAAGGYLSTVDRPVATVPGYCLPIGTE